MTLAVDTETTGVDFHHGARPFFVTLASEVGEPADFWCWDVDPETRMVLADADELAEIRGRILAADELVLQNPKFDAQALEMLSMDLSQEDERWWPWDKTRCTLLAGHLLNSSAHHDLTTMAMTYLGVDIYELEMKLKAAVDECRKLVRRELKTWRLAKAGLPDMPSVKGGKDAAEGGQESQSAWKADCWLPRAVAKHYGYGPDHEYWTVLDDYANADSMTTLAMKPAMDEELERRKLGKIYSFRSELPEAVSEMESHGVTLSAVRLNELAAKLTAESEEKGRSCVEIAAGLGYELTLPKNGVNDSLRGLCFGPLDLPKKYDPKSKTGAPTLNKAAMESYLLELGEGSVSRQFIVDLFGKRSRDSALGYADGYRKFWLPRVCKGGDDGEWFALYPNLNTTGTNTLRFSCKSPNEQNISKKEIGDHPSLRYAFGPEPGWEWYSMDASNIELRVPAYECGEEALIRLFEAPNEAPFYGSYHMLVFSILWPELWEPAQRTMGPRKAFDYCKKLKEYGWTKNGNFAIQYGAVEREDGWGTADRAYHQRYAHRRVKSGLPKMEALNKAQILSANRRGYVETIPDSDVDSDRGYPLTCKRNDWGGVLETIPLSYHVQGTAMWWMTKAMVRCHRQLREWREKTGFDGRMIMQVHDELVFAFPCAEQRPWVGGRLNPSKKSNLWRARVLQGIMADCGKGIKVPTPVAVEYHADNWGTGVKL